jgi:hypothetical protein
MMIEIELVRAALIAAVAGIVGAGVGVGAVAGGRNVIVSARTTAGSPRTINAARVINSFCTSLFLLLRKPKLFTRG